MSSNQNSNQKSKAKSYQSSAFKYDVSKENPSSDQNLQFTIHNNEDDSIDLILNNSNSISVNYDDNSNINSLQYQNRNKQMITKTDSIESSFLQIPGKRNAGSSNMSKNEQSIFRTNDWVVGSAKTLKKTMQTSSKKEYELLLDDEIGQSSKKSIAADSDRSNADLRLRQENILLRQEILKLKKALYMNNQQDEGELKVNQNIINEYQPNHFKIDNQMIPEINGSKEFSPDQKIKKHSKKPSIVISNQIIDIENIAPYQDVPRPYDEFPLKPEICSTNQSLPRGGTYNECQVFRQGLQFGESQLNLLNEMNNRAVSTDNSLCQNGESIELRLSLINQATFQNRIDGQFQRDTEDYRKFTIKDLERSYDNEDQLRISSPNQNQQESNEFNIQNILQDSDQNILNNLTLSKDEIDINETKDIISNYQSLQENQSKQEVNQICMEKIQSNNIKQGKRNSSIFEIQRHYELEIENLRKDLEMIKFEENRIKTKMDKQDLPISKEFTFKNDAQQLFEKLKNQRSQHDSSLMQTEDPSFCDQTYKFDSNPTSQNTSINTKMPKFAKHQRYMSNAATDSSFIPANKQIWQPPSFNNSYINTVQNSPINSNAFNSCFKPNKSQFQNEYLNEYGQLSVQNKQVKSKEFNYDNKRLDTEVIEQMFENPEVQKQFMPLDMIQSQKIRYYNSNCYEEIDDNFPKFKKQHHESQEANISQKISQCIKLIDNVQSNQLSEEDESSNYNQSIDFPFRSNQKSLAQSRAYDIKFETLQNHSQESPLDKPYSQQKENLIIKSNSPRFGGKTEMKFSDIYETNESLVSLKKKQMSVDLSQEMQKLRQSKNQSEISLNKSIENNKQKSKPFKYSPIANNKQNYHKPKSQLKNYNQKSQNVKKQNNKNQIIMSEQSTSKEFQNNQTKTYANQSHLLQNNYQDLSGQLKQSRSQASLNKLSKRTSSKNEIHQKSEFDSSACKNSYFQEYKRSSLGDISQSSNSYTVKQNSQKLVTSQKTQSVQQQNKITQKQLFKNQQINLNQSNGLLNHQKLLNSSNKISKFESTEAFGQSNKFQSPFKKKTLFSAGKYPNTKLYSQIKQEKLQSIKKMNEPRRNSMIDIKEQKQNKSPRFISKEVIQKKNLQIYQQDNQSLIESQIKSKQQSSRTPQPQSPLPEEVINCQGYVVENQLFMSLFNNARNIDIFNKEMGLSTNRSQLDTSQNLSKSQSRINSQDSTPMQSCRKLGQTSIFQKQQNSNNNSNCKSVSQSLQIPMNGMSNSDRGQFQEKQCNSTISITLNNNQDQENKKGQTTSLQSFLQIANHHKKSQQKIQNLFKRTSNISQKSANTSINDYSLNDSKNLSPLIQKQQTFIRKSLGQGSLIAKANERPKQKTIQSLFSKNDSKSRANQTIVTKSKDKYFTNNSVDSSQIEETNYSNRMSRQSSNKSICVNDKGQNKQSSVGPQIYGKFIKIYNEANSKKCDLEPIVEDC